jgi:HEAT repeat protein
MVLGRMIGRGSLVSCVVLALVLATPAARQLFAQDSDKDAPANGTAEPASSDNVVKLLQDGLTLFREAKYKEAVSVFEKAFALDPAHDQISRFMDSANTIYTMQMLRSDDPRISGIARTMLELHHKKIRTMSADPERIKALVDKVFASKDSQEQMVDMLSGANEFGRNLVPFLIPKLGDPETSVRTLALLWIPKVETDAIPPLMAAAHHPSAMVRRNVAALLGVRTIRHFFPLGTLAGMVETDPDASVKAAARESMENILNDLPETQGKGPVSAKVLHYKAASLLYLYPHKNIFAGPHYQPTIYTLKEGEVVGEVVAPFQLSPRMAEAELIEAIRLDPAYQPAKVGLLADEALQVLDYDSAVMAYGDKEPEIKAVLDSQKETMDWIRRNRIRSYSPETTFSALSGALREHRPEVAEKLIEVIQASNIRGPVPPALVQALTEGSSRLVRIASAVALAYWNPEDPGDIGEAVVSTLSEAAVNSGIRTVHKVMGNSLNASRFDGVFRDLNLESGSNYPNIAQALERSITLPPDLILLDEEVAPVTGAKEQAPVNAFITELRKAYRTRGTPVVVAVDPARLAEKKRDYESEERKVVVIGADADKTIFKNQVIEKLFAGSDDNKARATKLAARAGEALAYLTSVNTRFPIGSARGPLTQALLNRPDEVRIPCLTALGNLRQAGRAALRPIADVYANKENDPKVREAAMVAVGKILLSGKEAAPPEVLTIVASGLSDTDPKLREASYVAFSATRAPAPDQLRLLIDEAKVPTAGAPAGDKGAGKKPAEGGAEAGADAAGEKPAGDDAKAESKEGDAEKGDKAEKAEKPEKPEDAAPEK